MSDNKAQASSIPRDKENDNTQNMAERRREFVTQQTQTELNHVGHYSLSPEQTAGNIENFIGVAQVPIGLAGPIKVNGEHAKGEFYVPLATTEGTLVASYNRGMRVLGAAGGVKVTVVDDAMQRAPVFIFEDARQAHAFGIWVNQQLETIKNEAQSTTSVGKLRNIEQYAAARMLYLRFNFTTGDAAGQNMVGKATFAACEWIKANYPGEGLQRYNLSGAMDTDKKHSQLNTLHTRGKRVIAEAKISNDILKKMLGVTADMLFKMRQVSNMGSFMAGSINNGSHSANGITAMFIACGQDAANVAESSAALSFVDVDAQGDFYIAITIPSLIVATYGGGTALATQKECLEMMDCFGEGKAHKLAEIIGATVLAGELSLSAAVLAGDWVTSHDALGRNR
ncbi:hydroxymethylglutaryl-CoA reductase [Paraglaciecola sp. 20A4]|uniref:hydroxymethylglutaryl-CoA reductase n=1 Tax=Paraglaciecola sp. 20A4 TaxID=2687288 RepID=UPI00140B3338|nr:hydroxymethylglutaryl-CoA reductase [Paraglaciecola sp. 20A4]